MRANDVFRFIKIYPGAEHESRTFCHKFCRWPAQHVGRGAATCTYHTPCYKSECPHKLALYWKLLDNEKTFKSIHLNIYMVLYVEMSANSRGILSFLFVFTLCSSSHLHFQSQLIHACYSLNLTMSAAIRKFHHTYRAGNLMKTIYRIETVKLWIKTVFAVRSHWTLAHLNELKWTELNVKYDDKKKKKR